MGWHIAKSVLGGYCYSLFSVLAGFMSLQWAFDKSLKVFLAVTLGGMFFRFLLLGLVLFLVMRFTQMHFNSFLISLLGFFFILQFFEIRYINKELTKGKESKSVSTGQHKLI